MNIYIYICIYIDIFIYMRTYMRPLLGRIASEPAYTKPVPCQVNGSMIVDHSTCLYCLILFRDMAHGKKCLKLGRPERRRRSLGPRSTYDIVCILYIHSIQCVDMHVKVWVYLQTLYIAYLHVLPLS